MTWKTERVEVIGKTRLDDETASLGTLATHGLIKSDRGPLELTADVAFSLRLDNADHPAAWFH